MSVLSKMIYKFNAIPIKIPTGIFAEIDKLTLNVCGNVKSWNIKNFIIIKEKNWGTI